MGKRSEKQWRAVNSGTVVDKLGKEFKSVRNKLGNILTRISIIIVVEMIIMQNNYDFLWNLYWENGEDKLRWEVKGGAGHFSDIILIQFVANSCKNCKVYYA